MSAADKSGHLTGEQLECVRDAYLTPDPYKSFVLGLAQA